jgi:hypothetical protein
MSADIDSYLDPERVAACKAGDAASAAWDALFLGIQSAPAVIAKATVYRARVGWRRTYPTEAEMRSYEGGWFGFPDMPRPVDGPALAGWEDAERQQEHRDEAKEEERHERAMARRDE